MPDFVGAIDQGTTSTRFSIFDVQGNPVAAHQIEFNQIFPQSGWHEHNPDEIFKSVEDCINNATDEFVKNGNSIDDIKAIGLTNQRETTFVWDSESGETLHNAIAWPDTRTAAMVRDLKQRQGADDVLDICGLPLSTYPSSVKLLWLLENDDKVKEAYNAGRLAFGTPDTFLLYKLTGGAGKGVFVSDCTNASRTMFMNLHKLEYDDKMLDFFRLDPEKLKLPKIVSSSSKDAFGVLDTTKLKGKPITGVLGDQSAALVGQNGFYPGTAKNTYGTGCFLLYNVGEKPVISRHGLLATVAFDFGTGKPAYALEGSIAVAGSAVKFLTENLKIATKSHEITSLAESVDDNGGCIFVTAFSGLFAPYWIDDAKGTIFGITQHTNAGHIARATLEATCFQTKAILDAMAKDSGKPLDELRVDGGMSNSDLCMQTQADIIGIPVNRPAMRETTSLGSAIAAGFAVGVWKDFDSLKDINSSNRDIFKPKASEAHRAKMYTLWTKAVEMCRGWDAVSDDTGEAILERIRSGSSTKSSKPTEGLVEKLKNLVVGESAAEG